MSESHFRAALFKTLPSCKVIRQWKGREKAPGSSFDPAERLTMRQQLETFMKGRPSQKEKKALIAKKERGTLPAEHLVRKSV